MSVFMQKVQFKVYNPFYQFYRFYVHKIFFFANISMKVSSSTLYKLQLISSKDIFGSKLELLKIKSSHG